jgi:hypothetical protein
MAASAINVVTNNRAMSGERSIQATRAERTGVAGDDAASPCEALVDCMLTVSDPQFVPITDDRG